MPFPTLTDEDLSQMFTYHPPDLDQIPKYGAIRSAAFEFAHVLLANTPPSPDQSAALRSLRVAVMQANAAIALGGRY